MFRSIPFSESELRIIDTIPGRLGAKINVRNTPVSPRENMNSLYFERKPFWIPMQNECRSIMPSVYSMNLGRGRHADCEDIFGVQWVYVETAGGSIVRPGTPLLEDIADWREVIKIPDIDQWDWAADAEKDKIDTRFTLQTSLVNGFWFERLISFMDFMPAAIALIDEDATDEIKALFQATTDLGCRVIDKICEYWPALDEINIHDDWGAQKAPFFSMEVAYELFVPYMKQLTDHIHSKGRVATLHSCGHNEERVQCYIDGGFDQWQPQTMNNIHKLYEEYGDKMVFIVWPDEFDFENTTEEEQRAAARAFVEAYTQPGKPVLYNEGNMRGKVTDAFKEEVYIHSRKIYAERG